MGARVLVERDVPVPLRDGVTLRADVYRPDGEGAFPALVERTPYSKSNGRYVGGLVLNPLDAAQHGYAVVVQDVRGRFASEGEWEPFVNEADDGADTVAWTARQPWSNGRVGVYGASYMGVTALQTLVAAPPAVQAGVLYMTGSDYYRAWTYAGGPFELKFNLIWTLRLARETLQRKGLPDDDYVETASRPDELLATMPIDRLPVFAEGAPYWRRWHEHPTYDGYWQSVDAASRADRIAAPVLHVSGWYDHFLRGHLDLYDALERRGAVEQRFMVGPWDHGSYHSTTPSMSGDRDFGPRATNGPALMSPTALRWFDRWLCDAEVEPEVKVRYFVMGENRWRDSETWPPAATPATLHLHAGGVLETSPPADEPPDEYVYDPRDPVPTAGGRGSGNSFGPAGVRDQAAIAERTDVLCFTTEPLAAPLTIAGPVEVVLHASASTPSTDFTAKLVDVQPDGYCAILADGIVRARDLEPGHEGEHAIDLWATAHRFDRGHRVRLEISGGSYPRYDRNPNTGAQAATVGAHDLVPSTHRVFHDARRPSRLVLRVVRSLDREGST